MPPYVVFNNRTLEALGAYSYLDAQVNEAWVIGIRGDLTQPFELDNGDELEARVVISGADPHRTFKQLVEPEVTRVIVVTGQV